MRPKLEINLIANEKQLQIKKHGYLKTKYLFAWIIALAFYGITTSYFYNIEQKQTVLNIVNDKIAVVKTGLGLNNLHVPEFPGVANLFKSVDINEHSKPLVFMPRGEAVAPAQVVSGRVLSMVDNSSLTTSNMVKGYAQRNTFDLGKYDEREIDRLVMRNIQQVIEAGWFGDLISKSVGQSNNNQTATAPAVITYIPASPSTNVSGVSLFSATDLSSTRFYTNTASITGTATINNLTLSGLAGNGTKCLQVDNSGVVGVAGASCGVGAIGSSVTSGTAGSILFVDGAGNLAQSNNNLFWDTGSNSLGVGTITPSARITIAAGTVAAGTAPLKISAGANLAIPEDGAVEYDGSHLYITIGATRYQLDQQSLTSLGDPGSNGLVVRTANNVSTARTLTGTNDRIAVTNGSGIAGNPTIDIAATYTGQSSIITVGTITTGVWNGTALTDNYVSDLVTSAFFTGSGSTTTAVDLSTAEVSGTLGVGNGGSGATSLTGLLMGNGASPFSAVTTSSGIASVISDETGTGNLVLANSPVLVTPNLGIPSAVTLTNGTGLPISTGVSGLASGVVTFLTAPSSVNLLTAVTDETGTGALVFGTNPTFSASATFSGLATNSVVYTDAFSALTTTAPISGTIGYWSRSGTTLSPTTNTDNIYTLGNLSVGSSTTPTGGVAYFNGNVGIGNSSPVESLSIKSNATAALGFYDSTGNLSAQQWANPSQLITNFSGVTSGTQNWNIFRFNDPNNKFFFGDDGSKNWIQTTHSLNLTAGNIFTPSTSIAPQFILETSGNVGIGASSPYARTEISNNVNNSAIDLNTDTSGLVISNDSAIVNSYASLRLVPRGADSNVGDGNYVASITRGNNISDLAFGAIGGFSGTAAEYMRIQQGGNVGIGTTSPGEKLSVSSSIGLFGGNAVSTSQGIIKFYNPSYSSAYAGIEGKTNASGLDQVDLIFYTGYGSAGEKMRILSGSGNVGIGVSNPAGLLTLGGNRSASAWGVNGIALQGAAATYTDTTSTGTVANAVANSLGIPTFAASSATTYTSASTLYIAGPPTAGSNVTITNPAALVVASGNVGIGTSTPVYRFEVKNGGTTLFYANDVGTFGGTNGYATNFFGTNFYSSSGSGNSYIAMGTGVNKNIKFNTNNTDVGIFDSAGNFGIGDTSPAALLTVGNGDLFQVNSSGAIAAATGITSSGTINFSGLSASSAVYTDASKNLTTTAPTSGSLGYWSRSGTALQPATSTDNIVIPANGAASTPSVALTGTWFTGGDATTTKPQLLIEPTGTTSNNWSTGGTAIGVNAVSGFAGDLLKLEVNGSSKFRIDQNGNQYDANTILFNNAVSGANAAWIGWTNRSKLYSDADGNIRLSNNAGTGFSRLQFGGTTSSFPSLQVSGANLNLSLADNSAYTNLALGQLYASDQIRANSSGTTKLYLDGINNREVLNSNAIITWKDNTDALAGSADVALARSAAGILKVSDASTGYGGLTANSLLLTSNRSSSAWGVNGIALQGAAAIYTDTSSSGTVANAVANSLGIPTFAASSATTYTSASTLYIAGPPTAGSNVTITNPAALVVASGNVGIGTSTPVSALDVLGSINTSGNITLTAGSGYLRFGSSGGRSAIFSSADGVIDLYNNAHTDFSRLNFGGTTSSFPAIKRSGTTLQARLADDSGYASFDAGSLLVGGANINTGGTLSNVAYLDQLNIFSQQNTFNSSIAIANTVSSELVFSGANSANIYQSTSGQSLYINSNTGSMYLGANGSGSQHITILSSGNVGIGNTSPNARLDILDTTLAGSGALTGSVLNIAQTWSTSGTPTAVKLNVTDNASNANSVLMDLQVGGVSKFSVLKSGYVTSQSVGAFSGLSLNATGALSWSTHSVVNSPVDGQITLMNAAQNNFTSLNFGGTSSSFPAIKRNGSALDLRLADDSGYAGLTSNYNIISGNRSASAWGVNGIALQGAAATYTDTSSTGTVANAVANSLGIPTFAASSATTYTSASTLYIAGPPTAGSNVTITNPAALVVASGNVGIGTSSPALKLQVLGSSGYPATSGTTQTGVMRLITTSPGTQVLDMGVNNGTGTAWLQATSSTDLSAKWAISLNPNGGNVGIGDTSPASLLTVGSGDLFQVNSSGAIAAATGITSSGTINFSGLSASSAVYTDGSKNLTTTTPTSGTIGYWSRSGTTLSTANANDVITVSSSTANATAVYATVSATTGTNYAGNFQATGAATNNVAMYLNAANATNNYALQIASGNISAGSSNLTVGPITVGNGTATANVTGVYSGVSSASGSNYAGNFQASGAATNNTGLYVSATGATNNKAIWIVSPAASANNYAIYDQSGAQSYFAGNIGIGTASPSVPLEVKNNSMAQGLFYGWDEINGNNNYNGQILIGNTSAYQGRIHYNGNLGVLNIDNSYNNISYGIDFRTQTSSTPITGLKIYGNGRVSASLQGASGLGSPSLVIGDTATWAATKTYTIGFGYAGANYNPPAEIGYVETSGSGATVGDLIFATRPTATYVPGTERMRILSTGEVGIGDSSPASLFTVGNGDLFQINSSGQIGSQQAPVSDYLFALNGNTTNNNSRIIDIVQANNQNESSQVINIVNTANSGTITSGSRIIDNDNISLTPTATLSSASSSFLTLRGISNSVSAANVTMGNSGSVFNSLGVNGISNNVSFNPTINDLTGGGSSSAIAIGVDSILTGAPTYTSVPISYALSSYGGRFFNATSSAGNANVNYTSYGMYSMASGALTTTGNTQKYGGVFDVSNTADTNYGIFVSVTGATTNYAGIFTGGNVGIGTTIPTGRLSLAGNASASAWGLNGINLQAAAATYTDTTSSGTVTNNMVNTFGTPTLAASSATTYTNASTLYIAGPPTAGSNVTITNPQSLYVSSGNAYFGGNVGIGTASPNARLSFLQNVATGFLDNYSEYQILLYDGATASASYGLGIKSNTMVFNSAVGAYSFDRGASATSMYIDSSGNVGINTTGPDRKLDVLDASNPQMRLTYTDGSVYSDFQTDSSGYLKVTPTGNRTIINGTNYALATGNANLSINSTDSAAANLGGSIGFAQGGTNYALISGRTDGAGGNPGYMTFETRNGSNVVAEAMRITSGQRIGINTTTTTNGWVTINNTSGGIAGLRVDQAGGADGGTTYGVYSAATGSATNAGTYVGGYFSASVTSAGHNYGLIVNSGDVGIGTTAPTTKLEIGSSDLGNGAAGPVITLGRNNNGTATGAGSINFQSKGGTAGYVWQDNAGNLRINTAAPSNANDTAGTVVGTQTSTRDTKQDITDYTDYTAALLMVTNAPLHTFRYIKDVQGYGDNSALAKQRIGFIADEVASDFMWGNAIDQVSINGILMASVKALDQKISDLQTQVANIQGQQPGGQPTLSSNTPLVLHNHLYLSEDSVGEAKILSGSTSVRITFSKPYEYQPIVTITPGGRVGSEYWVADKDNTGFTIYIANGIQTDVMFDWHAFAGPQAKLTISDGSTTPITLVVANNNNSGQVLGDSTPSATDNTVTTDSTSNPSAPSVDPAPDSTQSNTADQTSPQNP